MSVTPLTTSPSGGGGVYFSVHFANAVFGMLPAIFALIVIIIIAASQWLSRSFDRGRRSVYAWIELMLLVPLVLLHLASLITSARLPAGSSLSANALDTTSYIFRLLASLAVFLGHFLWHADTLLVTNLYLLVSCLADGVRVYSLWRLAQLDPLASGFALPALQVAIMIMTAVVFLFSEICSSVRSREAASRGGRAHVDEASGGTCGMLFFGWLWPLLKYGLKNKLVDGDLQSAVPRPVATYKLQCSHIDLFDAGFWGGTAVQFLGALCIRLLGAATMLAQPFIINGIVSFLHGNKDRSVGVWLVVAMFFNQLANSLLQAHGEQMFFRLSTRVHSFLIHNVALRSFGVSPPENADWETAGSKVLVRLSEDSRAISGAIIMSGVIAPNLVVVGVGSYILFNYINLAFLGPLLAAVTCFLAPMLLGKPLSRSQRLFLEAAESRIQIVKNLISEIRNVRFGNMQHTAAQQVTQSRQREIDAALTLRRVLTFVVVAATFTMSLANLAAFGGVALMPRLSFDYTVLFTSLSMIQIMLTPLLSIIQMLPEFFSAFVRWKRIRDYVAEGTDEGKRVALQSASKEETAGLRLYLDNTTAEWAPDSAFLKGVHLSVSVGELVVVSGAPGCGKSSFLKALLGEVRISAGTMTISAAQLAYCDQVPWFIPEMTIKENILFGKAFDAELYTEVVAACCLDYDLPTLHKGHDTELASNGSPLSGGQRKRVSLARTLYDEGSDLVLLDDVFSGLDTKTRTQVVIKLFGPNGFLQKRRAAVIFCCTEAPSILSGVADARFYQLAAGSLTAVQTGFTNPVADEAVVEEAGDSAGPCGSTSPTALKPANNTERVSNDDQAIHEEALGQVEGKSSEAHRLYFKSLGSLASIISTAICLFTLIGIEKGGSFWLSHWAGQYAKSHGDFPTGYYIGIYAVFAVSGLAMSFSLTRMVYMKIMPASSISLHQDMLSVLVKTPASTTELAKSETVNRFMNDIEAVDMALPQALQNLVFAGGTSLGSLVVIAIGSPYAILSLVALLPLLWLLQKVYLSTSFQLRTLRIAAQAPMLEVASATVQGRLTVRALRADKFLSRVISNRIYHALLMDYIFGSVQHWAILMLNLVNGCLATAVAALLVGLGGAQSAGWGGLALVNTITLSQDAMLLLIWWTRFESSMASMERIYDYTHHTPQEKVVAPEAAVTDSWPEKGNITLDNLSLAYKSNVVVTGVTVSIASGNKVAVLGRTGSGKTSLLQAFFSLIDNTGGTLHVDETELSHVEPDTLRRRLVGHPQKFVSNDSGSVRDNLAPSGGVSDARIEEALGHVMTPEMGAEIMSKLDAKWSDCNFSEGWQQHIGICRTCLRESTVYVLDEPTSGMSQERHTAILDAILRLTADKTAITTTHTLVGIQKFDQVMVIQDGRLAEYGTPEELMNDEGSMLKELIRANSGQ